MTTLLTPSPVPMRSPTEPEWRAILRECGYPTRVLVIDFETYFSADYTLKNLSTWEYVTDPRFEEIGHAIVEVDQPFPTVNPSFWFKDDSSYLLNTFDLKQIEHGLPDVTVVAQNAAFDGLILWKKYGIKPRYVIDLLGLARHHECRRSNHLKDMAQREGLPPKGDTMKFQGLHLLPKMVREPGKPPRREPGMTEDQRRAMSDYACHDARLEWELFTRYLPLLSNPREELRVMQHTLELFWHPTLAFDDAAAVTLKGKMQAKVDDAVAKVGAPAEDISGNKSFSLLLATALDEAGDSIKQYQKPDANGKPILALAKDDRQRAMVLAHGSERVRDLAEARFAVKSWPLHISRIDRLRRMAAAAGGMLPVPLKYCGAHTGRWSGDELINLQNLSSRGDDLLNEIRHLIVAPEGKVLVVADASQIEARVLSWFADQEDLNALFRSGAEVYCEYAGKMVGRKLRKARKTDPPGVSKYLTKMRNMGKVQVLGCGYGMGALKCVEFAKTSYGVELTIGEAESLVQSYRQSVPKITKFWRDMERAFRHAAKYKETVKLQHGLIFSYRPEGDLTVITLPSGRELRYAHVRISIQNMKEVLWMHDPGKPGAKIFLWGGTLVENVVQAISRDLLSHGILTLEGEEHHVALHVHDELVGVEDKDQGEATLARFIEVLSTPPAWAEGCPLSAEGKVCGRYEK